MQKCQYSAKSMQQIGQLQHLGKIQRQVKPCHAENHGKPLSKGQRCSGLQQHRANVLMSTVSCVHQGSTAWRTETNETTKPVKVQRCSKSILSMSSLAQRIPRKNFLFAVWANVGLHSLRATDPLESQKSLRGKEDRCERSAKTLQVRCKDGIKVSRVRGRHSQSTSDRKESEDVRSMRSNGNSHIPSGYVTVCHGKSPCY